MNQNQDLKMTLLDKFGIVDEPKTIDFCREAYKFLTEDVRVDGLSPSEQPSLLRTATIHDASASGEITAVDLGLPSGTLWADRNLGAKSPSDYGAFVSWGNTDLHFPEKGEADWGDNDEAFKDYEFTSDEYDNTPGAKITGDIDLEHDAAHANLGGDWRMPTKEQFQELYDKCKWIRATVNGVNGYLVVSKINKASIFFACSGYYYGTSLDDSGSYGYYWSSSWYSSSYGFHLYFNSGRVYPQNGSSRYFGFSVRAVQNVVPKK